MSKRRTRYRYDWVMSDDCRRQSWQRATFLDWMTTHYSGSEHPPTPEEVVKAAKRKTSSIHSLFEWDVNKAAHQSWLAEAGYYLRHLLVVKIDVNTNVEVGPPVRAFIPLKRGRYGRVGREDYRKAQRVANMPSLKQTVLERAHADFLAFLDRYKAYSEFMNSFDPVIRAYEKVSQKKNAS